MIAVASAFATAAAAQNYPAKPIRLVVGFPAGGPADIIARTTGQKLSELLGQQVVIDNRGGASGMIAAENVAKSAPDGYTTHLAGVGVMTTNPVLYKNLSWDPVKSFEPTANLAVVPYVVVAGNNVPAKGMQELMALAKAKPGTLNCAHSGPGTTAHLGCEMLKSAAKIDIVPIPYKGTVPAFIDVVAGQAQLMFAVMQGGLPQVKAGKLKALAVTSRKRTDAMPDLPSMIEAGVKDFEVSTWIGVLAPRGTPPEDDGSAAAVRQSASMHCSDVASSSTQSASVRHARPYAASGSDSRRSAHGSSSG